jgi:predicted RNA-binding Zn ribbon-like protein
MVRRRAWPRGCSAAMAALPPHCNLTGVNMFGGEERDGVAEPGGRRPAPGQLALVQAFLNTYYDRNEPDGGEVLRSASALTSWLSAKGLTAAGIAADEADVRQALELRAALRALVQTRPDTASRAFWARLDRAAGGTCAAVTFAAGEPRFASPAGAGATGALGAIVAIAAVAMLDWSWTRLKICPGKHCGWVFYDHSRNDSGRWCSMSLCGAREKARRHYRRQRHALDGS